MRRVWILAAAAVLASCSPKAKTGAEAKYAGLDEAILAWRQQIVKTDKACSAKADGCQSFEVGCKGEREITPSTKPRGQRQAGGGHELGRLGRRAQRVPAGVRVLRVHQGGRWLVARGDSAGQSEHLRQFVRTPISEPDRIPGVLRPCLLSDIPARLWRRRRRS
uniref:Lipoprotein n=1 Tax=Phenylobacterium glaciei TaxID=2803784 RepID=A0A974P2M7_9CAUL|nr:hypothetical protein JKL49_21945 [Phenylobacterium glaciei]